MKEMVVAVIQSQCGERLSSQFELRGEAKEKTRHEWGIRHT